MRKLRIVVAMAALALCAMLPFKATAGESQSAFVGMWCMERPSAIEVQHWYGTVSLIIQSADEHGFSAIYIWDSPHQAWPMRARLEGNRFVLSGGSIHYVFETMLQNGRIVGAAENRRHNNTWRAIFKRTSQTATAPDGTRIPKC